ncbi:ATP-binding cassette domain-containing protein [[Clostridium] fimetarium]|uniref:Iron(III) transport system ATP-binding protein/putative spermidine/putrescine transport system ATP-binding protein/tungstate transport system ATP-binding protein n=1 Tax=[Clostridium] fimetarium TaxID=99656 RepID=A0A1I0REY3_9FIRM|nr:ATP-binding cassette domain-containing protein [[Clostridium] fimetarium]SEW39453.1 iron(III) transport system ATP-binding protein/putative spermidine/putrescine transport system ATP-binding protein/tungstate transport system ATP-binding protein [[Clostridium] fimetarium]
MKIIECEKSYKDFHLNIKDFELEDQKIHGIVGNNGCGKSTLVKIIAGLLKPDLGVVDYGPHTMQDITITTQRPYMLHDTVYNNLIYPLKIRKMILSKDEIAEWISKCGLSGKEKQYAPSLSSGERQKLSFARSLIFKPKVVLIDETMANLDPDSVALFEQIISEIQLKEPITWIIVSHQLAHIYNICDVVHFMEAGTILQSGIPKEVFSNPQNSIIRKYLQNYMVVGN